MAKDIAAVVAEDLQGQFKVFGEQLTGVERKVDLLAEDMDQVKSDIVDMKRDIKEIRGDITEINGKLDKKADKDITDSHEERIVKMENVVLAKA